MNVLLLPADTHGCGYYRMRMPGHYAESDTTVRDRLAIAPDGSIRETEAADVVVFQRPMHARMPDFVRQFQRQGVAVVVELDDDMGALDAQHVTFAEVHPKRSPESNWRHLKTCCSLADLVTVTTPALAQRYAAHGRYAVLPNYVESALLNVRPDEQDGFGWAGYVPTHPNDLQVAGPALRDVARFGHCFRVIGPSVGVREAADLDAEPESTGWLDLASYYREVSTLRAGIVPLADSAFNRAKSWLKGLEYAALGVPFVATPTPEYQRLQNEGGAGLMADKPRTWRNHLHSLLSDETLHMELADHARQCVRSLTIERNAWCWDEAWARAVTYRHARAANPAHRAKAS